MRLEKYEIEAIKNISINKFGSKSRIILFGSRVDDSTRGGDIDLYVIPDAYIDKKILRTRKLTFLVELKSVIGDQKIDLIIAKDGNRLIEKEALSKGIFL